MELKEIKGLNKAIIKKLKEKGYTNVESLKELDLKKLIELGFNEKLAKEIIKINQENESKDNDLENNQDDTKEKKDNEKESKDEFTLKKENKYLVAGFKATKKYNPDLKGEKLEKVFNEFKRG